jgi:hypothetical protein
VRRRAFLKGALAAGLLAHFGLGRPRRAEAAAPMRALFVYVPDGCIPSLWHPSGSETAFTLPAMSQPLDRIKSDLLFLKGIEMAGSLATHEGGVRKLLTGTPDANLAISLDVLLGERLKGSLPFSSIQLGVGAGFQNGSGSMSFVSGGQPVMPDDNPVNAFSRLFAGYTASGQPDAATQLANARKKRVLDAAKADLDSLRARLGPSERVRLATHLGAIEEVEQRLTGARAACDSAGWNAEGFKVIPTDYYPKTYEKEENFLAVGKLQMDLGVLALACDLTRVVSLMWSHPVSPTRIAGGSLGNHDASHYGDAASASAQVFTSYKRWFMDRFAYLIDRLRATPAAGGGNLLDSTVVFLGTELGDSNLHDHRNMPFVLAGGRAAGLKLGRYLDYSGQNVSHTRLLSAIANLCGVPQSGLSATRFGGAAPLDGLV